MMAFHDLEIIAGHVIREQLISVHSDSLASHIFNKIGEEENSSDVVLNTQRAYMRNVKFNMISLE